MRSRGLWLGALRWRSRGAVAAGSRKLVPVMIKPFSDEPVSSSSQWQHLQQAGRLSWKTSALLGYGVAPAGPNLLYPFCIQQSHFATSEFADPDVLAANPDEALLHVLRCEVEDLTKRYMNITARKPPKSFTLVRDEPSEVEMTLTRIYGLEDITMSCVQQVIRKEFQRKPEVGEDPDSRTKMLQLTISIRKGGPFPILKIRCECYRDGFAIHQVDLEGEDEEQTVYRPYFSNAAEGLVNTFQIFLYERGLNADLAGYIENHLERKRLLKSAAATKKMIRFLESQSSGQTGD